MALVLPLGHYDAGPVAGPATGLIEGLAAAPVTALFAVLCALVFLGPQDRGRDAGWAQTYGAVPTEIAAAVGGGPAEGRAPGVWPLLTLATSLAAHASWAHLFYNLLALWVFGVAVERALGSGATVGLYLGLGALACAAEVAATAGSAVPIVGASGAVAVVAGAFAVGFPRARVVVAVLFLTVPVPAWVALAVWAAVEVVAGTSAGGTGVAHVAHLSGFALGAVVAGTWIRSKRREGSPFVPDDRLRTEDSGT